MRQKHAFLAIPLFVVLISGCATMKGVGNTAGSINTNFEKSTEMTGLFMTADEAINKAKENLKVGETSCPVGLKDAGFDPDAKNVIQLPGNKGLKYILGVDNPQIKLDKPEDIEKFSSEFNRYYTVVYPIRDPKKNKQAVYFNKQDLLTTGPDGEYYIVCRDKILYNNDFGGVKDKNVPGVNKRLGGNVLEFLLNAVNPVRLFIP